MVNVGKYTSCMDPMGWNKYMKSVVVPNNLSNWRNSCFRFNLKHNVSICKYIPVLFVEHVLVDRPLVSRDSSTSMAYIICIYKYNTQKYNLSLQPCFLPKQRWCEELQTKRIPLHSYVGCGHLNFEKKLREQSPMSPRSPKIVSLHLGFVRYNRYNNPYPAEVSTKCVGLVYLLGWVGTQLIQIHPQGKRRCILIIGHLWLPMDAQKGEEFYMCQGLNSLYWDGHPTFNRESL